jgi:hypothetical protein
MIKTLSASPPYVNCSEIELPRSLVPAARVLLEVSEMQRAVT